MGKEGLCLILDGPDVTAAPAHHEAAVPLGRQQQLEVDLRLDDAGHDAVFHSPVAARHVLCSGDPQIDEIEGRERAATLGDGQWSVGVGGQPGAGSRQCETGSGRDRDGEACEGHGRSLENSGRWPKRPF